jgi:hypothetical protein
VDHHTSVQLVRYLLLISIEHSMHVCMHVCMCLFVLFVCLFVCKLKLSHLLTFVHSIGCLYQELSVFTERCREADSGAHE